MLAGEMGPMRDQPDSRVIGNDTQARRCVVVKFGKLGRRIGIGQSDGLDGVE